MSRPQLTIMEMERYLEFLRRLQLCNVALIACNWRASRNFRERLGIRIATKFKISRLTGDGFTVLGSLRLLGSSSGARSAPMMLDATFELVFVSAGPITREEVEQFCRRELRMLAWPYYRELVASLCVRADIQPIRMPFPRAAEEAVTSD